MAAVLNYPAVSISDILSRFEEEVAKTSSRDALVKLFCSQIIPFISNHPILEPLRSRWIAKQQAMAYDVDKSEQDTLEEIQNAFVKINSDLQASTDNSIQLQITKIENILRGRDKYYSPPIYVVLFDELKQLLELALAAGHAAVCKKYCKLNTRSKSVQKDPAQKTRWGLLNEQGVVYKILSSEEASEVKNDPNLLKIPPDIHWIDETFIELFTIVPSLSKTYESKRAIQSEQTHDPAVVWWWMQGALRFWNTPQSHFEQPTRRPKTQTDCSKHFTKLCEVSVWREIEDAKRGNPSRSKAFIFTDTFFRNGLATLTNETIAFLSNPDISTVSSSSTFELQLNDNELWILVTPNNSQVERLYLQKFHDGEHPNGSSTLRFVKKLFQKPQGGKIEVELLYKSESIAKYINRLRLPKDLKKLFFHTSHSDRVQFNGVKITAENNPLANVELILKELRKNHQKAKI